MKKLLKFARVGGFKKCPLAIALWCIFVLSLLLGVCLWKCLRPSAPHSSGAEVRLEMILESSHKLIGVGGRRGIRNTNLDRLFG